MELNRRFNDYGIYIEVVNVMKVIMPKDLRVSLMQTTAYDVHLQNQVKYQQNLRIKLTNSEGITIQNLKNSNDKILDQLEHQIKLEQINLEKMRIEEETSQKLRIIEAM